MRKYLESNFSYARAGIALVLMFMGGLGILLLSLSDNSILPQNQEKVVCIIDTSLSMAIEDVGENSQKPVSRLDLAKNILKRNITDGSSVSLISYAKYPTLVAPFTNDIGNISLLVDSLNPQIEGGGSDLALALTFAKNLYEKEDFSLFIFTDGGSTSKESLPTIPPSWDVHIYGIGSMGGGKIPLGYNANGERRYKYFSGAEIVVPYEKKSLESVSSALNAELIHFESGVGSLSTGIFSTVQRNILIIVCLFFIIGGILIHPFQRKLHTA